MSRRCARRAVAMTMVLTLLVAAPPVGIATPVDAPEFSALYVGNGDDYDFSVFSSRFADHGWRSEVQKSSNYAIADNRPRHYHFTHGASSDMVQAADDGDILYVSGHGLGRAFIPIYDARYDLLDEYIDDISPDTNCTNPSNWEVGVDWLGEFPNNESRWDTDIEWVIFAACSQLRTRAQGGEITFGTNNGPAKAWARTLLGSPARAHAILGYWDTGAGDGHDYKIVNSFHDCAFHKQYTVVESWVAANRQHGESDWAYVTHSANRADRLIGVGSGPLSDTTGTYYLNYYAEGLAQRILDGRGGLYESPTVSRAEHWGWLDWLRELTLPSVAMAKGRAPVPERIDTPRTRFTIGERVRRNSSVPAKGLAPVRARVKRPRAEAYLEGGISRTERSASASGAVEVAWGRARGAEGTESVTWSEDGALAYHAGRGIGNRPIGISRDQAVKAAKHFLGQRGELPSDAVVADVREVTVQEWTDLDDASEGNPTVTQYSVRFVQRVGDHYIEGPGAGMVVTVGPDGVDDVFKRWYELQPTQEQAVVPGRASDVLATLLRGADDQRDISENARVRNLDVVLYADGASAETLLQPAWRAELESGAALYGDAVSGGPVRGAAAAAKGER